MSDCNNLPTFNFDGNEIYAFERDGEVWFDESPALLALGYANPRKTASILDDDEKGVRDCYTPGGIQKVNIISEPGLYKVMARSRKPGAKKFDRFVRHEVLPAIRKHGRFEMSSARQGDLNPEVLRGTVQAIMSLIKPEIVSMIHEAVRPFGIPMNPDYVLRQMIEERWPDGTWEQWQACWQAFIAEKKNRNQFVTKKGNARNSPIGIDPDDFDLLEAIIHRKKLEAERKRRRPQQQQRTLFEMIQAEIARQGGAQ